VPADRSAAAVEAVAPADAVDRVAARAELDVADRGHVLAADVAPERRAAVGAAAVGRRRWRGLRLFRYDAAAPELERVPSPRRVLALHGHARIRLQVGKLRSLSFVEIADGDAERPIGQADVVGPDAVERAG